MFRFLKKLWNWLQSRFRPTTRPARDSVVAIPRSEWSDADYENLLMALFEEVARGTTAGELRGWLIGRGCDDRRLARWLRGKAAEWGRYPADYRRLARDLAALAEVATGELAEVARRISLQLSSEVQSSASEVQSSASEVQSSASEVQGSASEVQSSASEVQGSASEVQRSASEVQRSASEVQRSASEVQGSASEVQSSASEVQSSASEVQNSASEVQSSASEVQSSASEVQSSASEGQLFTTEARSLDSDLKEMKPDDHEAWKNRGNALYNLGRYEEALDSYNRALDIKPDFHKAWNGRGIALDKLGRYEEALDSYNRALDIKPDDYKTWTNRGITLGKLGRNEEALDSFDKALEFKPDDHKAWNGRGMILGKLGQNKEALDSSDRALKIQPDDHEIWYNRGVALYNLGRNKEALDSLDRALKLKPDLHENWYGRGVILGKLGRYEEALKSYSMVLKIKPNDHEAWNNRGIALGNLGRNEEALDSFDKALEFKPDWHQAWESRGVALDNLGRYDEAIDSYNKALEFKPDYHEAWHNRATAICHLNTNRIYTPSLQTLIQRKPIPALQDREPHLFALREALPHLTEGSLAYGQIYRYLGDAYLKHSRDKENARPYWRDAIRHYQIALPILTAIDFPEDHLAVLQGLIRAHLALTEITEARFYQQQGCDLFLQLLAKKPDRAKPAFESQFSGFSHLEIDLLIEENDPVQAIEQAEFYKNRCLTWILDRWQENPTSPDFATMRGLTNPNTAIVYWYLSEDNLTTFMITADSDRPRILDSDRRQQKQRFDNWRTRWDNDYRDYADKKETDNKKSHPWRVTLESRLLELKQILEIEQLVNELPESVDTLILVPHRDLHRFPVQNFFPEKYTGSYLPSLQTGLRFPPREPSYSPLLSIEDPATGQKPMIYAQIESVIISHLVGNSTRILPDTASPENVLRAIENRYKTLHFTGHGKYNAIRPETSSLALKDGTLTAKQISALTLSGYSLVCLASCETALTGNDGITTEYVGLPGAFLKAGASNVLSTLWPVEGISSAWLMIKFYQGLLTGDPPSLALKNARTWLKTVTWRELADWITELSQLPLEEGEGIDRLQARAKNTLKEGRTIGLDRPTKYSDPYYWAAFTLTGQG